MTKTLHDLAIMIQNEIDFGLVTKVDTSLDMVIDPGYNALIRTKSGDE
jgi:hypothetical protein